MQDLSKIFLENIKNNKEFLEALDIVKNNSQGKIWIIGGFVYRNIINKLYGTKLPEIDIDFIVEKINSKFELSKDYKLEINSFGNTKILKDKMQIDIVPLDNISYIKSKNLEPNILNYLKGTPLNIQSIAFDLDYKILIGDLGIESIKNKIIKINNLEFAKIAARKKNKTLEQYIKEKVGSLKFTFES